MSGANCCMPSLQEFLVWFRKCGLLVSAHCSVRKRHGLMVLGPVFYPKNEACSTIWKSVLCSLWISWFKASINFVEDEIASWCSGVGFIAFASFTSFTATRDSCFRYSFSNAGLRSSTTDLGDGTVMHVWVPKSRSESKPALVLIHGFGANAMWQWNDFLSPLISRFNVYVPDLLFFGDSYTTRPERSEQFQAHYGGFVGYSMAAQFKERVEKLVLCCAGVCLEEKDMEDGMFKVKSVDEAVDILLPQTPDKLRELMKISFYKPTQRVPSCFLNDFIRPTVIIWGEHDQIFPLELGYRLKRHLGDNAELVIIKNAGHAINVEKPKELYKHLKSVLVQPISPAKPGNYSNGCKKD
ncbi:hypothetical protein V6N11_034244 [Hibiscus sabdariffa]|uniref:AB hydrolase-1 domain-containing protein n=1 Tax=Hibiscus sabdariffa TaxID=183260 RepID=A0ABR1ZGZ0_9ROSI